MGNVCNFCRNGRRAEQGKELQTSEPGAGAAYPSCGSDASPARRPSRRRSKGSIKGVGKGLSFRPSGTASGFSNGTPGGGEESDGSKRTSSPSLRSSRTLAPEEEDQLRSFYERNLVEQERHVSYILNEEAKLRRGKPYSRVPTLQAGEGPETLVPVDPEEVNEAMARFDVFSPDERQSRVDEILEKYVEAQVEGCEMQSARSSGGLASPGSSMHG
ncbi:hypothetical protein TGARI_289615 [Toxoplasma gondii ARI]|uniref:Uncharacterized protein n=4 Tax=Toxoplasma gondii TaxID=5811 RepID=A0A2G8Y315_TOXGO|nr:hypothetical protein TGMAS_289615 [Toxoplasma gondii MAS]KYF45113.1 hypothetical protein TGARI_289615 [Toxoplasma gondii ARI]PIM01651.1 hypothetical protein TGCOUG_289615 [Toxoplasma gondii COUG]PUA90190.1 hypothetical protein TGBR9_289615 [Toxoplasma gondii TgCATBr9]